MRSHLLLFAVVALISLFLASCAGSPPEDTESTAVSVHLVSYQTVIRDSKVYGTLVAGSDVNLSFTAGGEVEDVKVAPGDFVEEGTLLLSLDTKVASAHLAQSEAAVLAARAAYSKAELGIGDAEMEQLQAQLSQAEAGYEAAEKNYQRMKTLYENNAISLQQLEGAEVQMKSAEAAYIMAKTQLEIASDGTPVEHLEAARAQLRQAEAAHSLAVTQMDGMVIKAPFSGIVSYVNGTKGETVGPGMPVVGLMQDETVIAEVYVSEGLIGFLEKGDYVQVSIASANRDTFGLLAEVSPVMDPRAGGYRVRVELSNIESLLKPGMLAAVTFIREAAEDVLAIPRAALLSGEKGRVFVVRDGVAREQLVVTGLDSGGWVEIRQGLSLGDPVITKGHHFLIDGMKVNLEETD